MGCWIEYLIRENFEFVGVIKMKCPYCGEEMQLGCIQCRDGVYWSEKERVIAALNIGGGKSIKLNEKSIGGPFGGASAEAWLCEKCKKIVIEYGKILFQRGYWDKLSFLKQHNLPIE